jgi:RNA polymerase sigma factor (sigma-70 family)
MLDLRRAAVRQDEERERLFIDRYASLFAWALRLTNHQRDAAEDLVQDAFVQFMLGRTKLEEIENVDGYLRRMLRYMHIARMNRSAQHLQETALSVADYDSFRLGWSAIEPARRMQAFEELHQICLYACSRKESSRAGSVLILRFFHDYLPIEIARVLNSSRDCVDQWQRLARREAKLFINQPGRLRFVDAKQNKERQSTYFRSDCDLMPELRQTIFDSCRGECLPLEELAGFYSGSQADALSTVKLAHIVSCSRCLDAVNGLLGLPALTHRYSSETSDSKQPPQDPPGGPSGGGTNDLTRRFRRRLEETREHKPHELRISVNGFLVSSMKVSAELSELTLNLTPDQPVEFVELSSEQGVQLLFFSINPTSVQREQWAWIELSAGRSLETCFRNEIGPSLEVVYRDPELEPVAATVELRSLNGLSSPLFVVPDPDDSQPAPTSRLFKFGSKIKAMVSGLKAGFTWPLHLDQKNHSANETFLASFEDTSGPTRELLSFQSNRADFSRRRLNFVVVLLSVLIVTGFVLFKWRQSPTLSAKGLLEKAEAAEQASYVRPDQVKHRVIELEERRGVGATVVLRKRIEIWEDPATRLYTARLYDDSNRLVAATRQQPDGSLLVYHHGKKPRSVPSLETPQNLLLNFEDLWQASLSPQSYRAFVGDPDFARVEERDRTYALSYDGVQMIGATRLLKATLVLSRSELHAMELTLSVQRGDELLEYRFVETKFELLSTKTVNPTVFEIESELTGGAGNLGRPGDWALRDLTSSRVPPSPSTSTPPVASAELEVDVAYLLNQAKADRNEQVALTRSAGGSLRVEGVVASQERKDEFLRALGPVSDNPAVTINIRTISEATERPTRAKSISVQETQDTANAIATDEELRRYFSQKDPVGPTDVAIRAHSSEVVNRAYDVLFHAIEIKQLVKRFATVDMRTVAPDARVKWIRMLREHANALSVENAALRGKIQPIFFPGSPVLTSDEVSIQSDADLARAVDRLHRLALANNAAVRTAFTISTESSAEALKSNAFWQALLRVEKLSERIKQYEAVSH